MVSKVPHYQTVLLGDGDEGRDGIILCGRQIERLHLSEPADGVRSSQNVSRPWVVAGKKAVRRPALRQSYLMLGRQAGVVQCCQNEGWLACVPLNPRLALGTVEIEFDRGLGRRPWCVPIR